MGAQIGTLYKYDIIASLPCCSTRVECKRCAKPLVDLTKGGLEYYSQYSEKATCQGCSSSDYHFIKSVNETFVVVKK